jgi:outer membrane protein assembly factor BamD
VLYRLVSLQHNKSFTGLIFRSREIDRDMAPNRGIIQEYKRFYFLYPKSIFLDEVREFYREARESLADYERLVADYYFDRGQYNAAAGRYLYLLKYYPGYKKSDAAVERLIQSYRRNQQPDLADELERLRRMQDIEPPRIPPESAGSGLSLPGSDALSRLK